MKPSRLADKLILCAGPRTCKDEMYGSNLASFANGMLPRPADAHKRSSGALANPTCHSAEDPRQLGSTALQEANVAAWWPAMASFLAVALLYRSPRLASPICVSTRPSCSSFCGGPLRLGQSTSNPGPSRPDGMPPGLPALGTRAHTGYGPMPRTSPLTARSALRNVLGGALVPVAISQQTCLTHNCTNPRACRSTQLARHLGAG